MRFGQQKDDLTLSNLLVIGYTDDARLSCIIHKNICNGAQFCGVIGQFMLDLNKERLIGIAGAVFHTTEPLIQIKSSHLKVMNPYEKSILEQCRVVHENSR